MGAWQTVSVRVVDEEKEALEREALAAAAEKKRATAGDKYCCKKPYTTSNALWCIHIADIVTDAITTTHCCINALLSLASLPPLAVTIIILTPLSSFQMFPPHPMTTIEQLDDGFGGILQSHGHSSGGGLAAHQPTSHAPPMIDDVLASYDPYGTNVYKGTSRIYNSPLHRTSPHFANAMP